jgi:hypothetical protein
MSFSPTNGDRDHHQQQQKAYSGIVGNAARTIFGSSDDEAYLVSFARVSEMGLDWQPTATPMCTRLVQKKKHPSTQSITSLIIGPVNLQWFLRFSMVSEWSAQRHNFGNQPGNPSPIDSRGYGEQYLAHERLAGIGQQGHVQQHNHHHQQQQQGDLSPNSPGGYHQQHTNGFTSHHQYTNQAHRLSGSGFLHHQGSGIYNLSGQNGANGLASPMSNNAWAHSIAAAGPGKRA